MLVLLPKKTNYHITISDREKKLTDHKHDKHLVTENELKKLKTFDLGYFIGKSHFDEDGTQNYLVFQSMLGYFMLNNDKTTKWKSKGLFKENLEVVSTSDNTLTPSINYYRDKARLKFTGSVLQQKTITYNHKKVANLYIVYEIKNVHDTNNYPTLTNVLFGAAKFTKNAILTNINIQDMGSELMVTNFIHILVIEQE